MGFVRVEEDNFYFIIPLIRAMHRELNTPEEIDATIMHIFESLSATSYLVYMIVHEEEPQAFFATYVGNDTRGSYMFLEYVYSSVPKVGIRLIATVEKVAARMGLDRVKGICSNYRLADLSYSRGYKKTGIVVEKVIKSNVQKLNTGEVRHG